MERWLADAMGLCGPGYRLSIGSFARGGGEGQAEHGQSQLLAIDIAGSIELDEQFPHAIRLELGQFGQARFREQTTAARGPVQGDKEAKSERLLGHGQALSEVLKARPVSGV